MRKQLGRSIIFLAAVALAGCTASRSKEIEQNSRQECVVECGNLECGGVCVPVTKYPDDAGKDTYLVFHCIRLEHKQPDFCAGSSISCFSFPPKASCGGMPDTSDMGGVDGGSEGDMGETSDMAGCVPSNITAMCGGTCPTCANGLGCGVDKDCTSGHCQGNVCVPTCEYAEKNADGTSCGTPKVSPCFGTPVSCKDLGTCSQDQDCRIGEAGSMRKCFLCPMIPGGAKGLCKTPYGGAITNLVVIPPNDKGKKINRIACQKVGGGNVDLPPAPGKTELYDSAFFTTSETAAGNCKAEWPNFSGAAEYDAGLMKFIDPPPAHACFANGMKKDFVQLDNMNPVYGFAAQ